jgi:hypothetical protein
MTPDLFPDLRKGTDEGVVGLTVKLARDIDRAKPCHDNVATIAAGKPPHVGELRCAACGAHRGWLSHAARDFILETARRFGAPGEPFVLRQNQQEKTVADYDNTNRGALFRNDDKSGDRDPDYRGNVNVNGQEFWLSAWLKTSKKGVKYMSLSIKPKTGDTFKKGASARDDMNDAIPF